MDSKTKHRILGLLVIAGLVVIAIPLFHRNSVESMDNPLNQLPPFPDQSVQVQASENDDSAIAQPNPVVASMSPVSSVTLGSANEAKFVADSNKADAPIIPATGWVVQLGSFKNKVNALRLVNQLRAQGYHAFLDVNHAMMTRVFIGPENKKIDASLLADQVSRKTHLQGIIVNYKSLTL